MSDQPKGTRFIDLATSREMLLIEEEGHPLLGWICWRHPDGDWVTVRRASLDDLDRIRAVSPAPSPPETPAPRDDGPSFPGYCIVGEAPTRVRGKGWATAELNSGWVPVGVPADRDPRGNASGADDMGRFCLFLDVGAVELREGDRVIVLRPAPPRDARARGEQGGERILALLSPGEESPRAASRGPLPHPDDAGPKCDASLASIKCKVCSDTGLRLEPGEETKTYCDCPVGLAYQEAWSCEGREEERVEAIDKMLAFLRGEEATK